MKRHDRNHRARLRPSFSSPRAASAGRKRRRSRATPPAPYVMTMGDMMNTLVQPRHAKLGLAGHAGNWPLAAYALVEIRQAFAGIVKAQPKFRGYPVADLADAALKAAARRRRRRHQTAGREKIRRGLRSAQPRLQCLPWLARSSLRGDQGARRFGLSEPGFQRPLILRWSMIFPKTGGHPWIKSEGRLFRMMFSARASAAERAVDQDADRRLRPRPRQCQPQRFSQSSAPCCRLAIRARPMPSTINSAVVTTTEITLAEAIGRKTKGRMGTAAAKKSASNIHSACSVGIARALAAAVERSEQAAERRAILRDSAGQRRRLFLRQAGRAQALQERCAARRCA